jgi:hypothetical protein
MDICKICSSYIIGGFSVVPALAWNDIIKDIFLKIVPKNFGDSLYGKFTYAIIISLICFIIVKVLEKIIKIIRNTIESTVGIN